MAYVGISISHCNHLVDRIGAQLHMTLAHFEKPDDAKAAALAEKLAPIAAQEWPMQFEFRAVEHWEPVGDVLLVTNSQILRHVREAVLEAIFSSGLTITTTHAFKPHITLGTVGRVLSHALGRKYPSIYSGGHGLELCGTPVITRYYFPFESLSRLEPR